MRVRAAFLIGLPLTLVAAAPFGYSLTKPSKPLMLAAARPVDERKIAERLCASRIVNERLKAQLFDDAAAVGSGASANLDLLASFSEVRMEEPLLKSRDAELGVTVCSGRFVLLVPPGTERGFGGMRVLRADVEYAAQPAADGSGLVYQLKGADSIVYRLAAFNLRSHAFVPMQAMLAKAAPLPEPPLAVEPAPPELVVAPMPEPEPVAPVMVAKAEPVAAREAEPNKARKPEKADKPVKLAKAEPKADKPAKLAKSEPEAEKPAKLAKAESKATKPPVKLAAKVEKKAPGKAEKPAKRTELAEKSAKPGKAKKADKPERIAAVKPTPEKTILAKQEPAKKATIQLAAKIENLAAKEAKPAPAKPKDKSAPVRVAAAVPAKPKPAVRLAAASSCDSASGGARLVCANPALAAKKRTEANFYYASLENAGGNARRALANSRSRFLAYVDRCGSEACVAQAYEDRISEIRDIMAEVY